METSSKTTRVSGLAAESRVDFIHKLRIVLKELNETKSWLDQIVVCFLATKWPHISRKPRNCARGELPSDLSGVAAGGQFQ
jgi:hypothetical protein